MVAQLKPGMTQRAGALIARHAAADRHLPHRPLGLRLLARCPERQARAAQALASSSTTASSTRFDGDIVPPPAGRRVNVAVAGAGGRMGRTLIEAVLADRELQPRRRARRRRAAALRARVGDIRSVPTLGAWRRADVLIDFTRPEGTLAHLEACAAAMVIGTTGFPGAEEARSPRRRSASRSSWRRTSPSA